MYCYFATVNPTWNSQYPYVVGPTFYGNKTALKVPTITETVTTYTSTNAVSNEINAANIAVFPNPTSDLVAIQLNEMARENIEVALYDMTGKLVQRTLLYQGSTIAYFDTKTVYAGEYVVKIGGVSKKIAIVK